MRLDHRLAQFLLAVGVDRGLRHQRGIAGRHVGLAWALGVLGQFGIAPGEFLLLDG
jgi:hypothetical protein